jgi:Short C-terminal domain
MSFIKKAAKGTLAVGTLGASVAAERGIKAAAAGVNGKVQTQADLSPEDAAAGVLFRGMSHESGRNAEVTLYQDRIERVKERSRLSVSKAHQDVEMTPVRTISSVQTEKDGFYTKVKVHATGNAIDFKFRHEAAALLREQIEALILNYGSQPTVVVAAPAPPAEPDIADQIRKLGELRDGGLLTAEEFGSKKNELLQRM